VNPFEGELIRLAPLRREDISTYTRWFQDYQMVRFLAPGVLTPMSEEAETAWYDRAIRDEGNYHFGIRTLADDRLLGNCSLFEISHKNACATFGIFLGNRDDWGKGYGSDATRTILRFAFDELNLNRVQLEVYAFNPRAVRAYEKVGFCHEGIRRQALFREGSYHDIHIMAVLRDEWHAVPPE
jgi:RimJ/RimL family protein N-acetyltransferase